MGNLLIFVITVIGLSGIVAQVLILRELLVSFFGNELTLGIILANWVLSEAVGVFIIGKYIDKVKNKINTLIILQIIFSLALPLSIYLSRVFKNILGIPFGEAIGLNTIFFCSFLIILPLAFCHGALFSVGCKIYSFYSGESNSIGRIYAWEIIGTIIGGIILTYLFLPYLNSFQIALMVSICNLFICIPAFTYRPNRILRYSVLSLFILASYLFLSGNINRIHRISVEKQWKIGDILDYRNSLYGNIVASKREEQYTFFYNGLPVIITPYPDIAFVEEFGHLPLLFHRAPRDILIISSGAGGIISEILKHPIKKIDYLELDSLIINMLKKYPSSLTEAELKDRRVNVINQDGRFFLRNTLNRYDVVLIGISNPSDLSTNRFFTKEFFSLVKSRLNPEGILAFRLPGSSTYISQELRDLNVCIWNGLKDAYSYVHIIPGDYNMFLGSSSKDILKLDSVTITQKINQQNIKTNILMPDYLDYRLDKKRLQWFLQHCRGATRKTNMDFMPFAVFQMLVFWNKQFSPGFAYFLQSFQGLDLRIIFLLIFLMSFVFLYLFQRRPRLNIAYCIATTGFFGMLVNLILIFSFQMFYGYLYHSIGILISIFMAGIAVGSIFMTRRLGNIKNDIRSFINLEILIILFCYTIAFIITKLFGFLHYPLLLFMLICFIPGFFMGLQFPLASKIYSREKELIGQTAGLLYCSDLIGGWIAGIFGGIVFLPILGLFSTCIVIVMLKLSSLFLLLATKKKLGWDALAMPNVVSP